MTLMPAAVGCALKKPALCQRKLPRASCRARRAPRVRGQRIHAGHQAQAAGHAGCTVRQRSRRRRDLDHHLDGPVRGARRVLAPGDERGPASLRGRVPAQRVRLPAAGAAARLPRALAAALRAASASTGCASSSRCCRCRPGSTPSPSFRSARSPPSASWHRCSARSGPCSCWARSCASGAGRRSA